MSSSPLGVALAAVGALYLVRVIAIFVPVLGRLVLGSGGGKSPKSYGSWAVVTGATDGIGKAICFELAKQGMNVLLISRTEPKLQECAEAIKSQHSNVETRYLSIDYTKFDESAKEKVSQELRKLEGGLGVLVNNVGMSYPFPLYFHELEEADVKGLLELNVTSTTLMTYIALPIMLEQGKGAILNIGSAAGLHPSPLLALYSATKAFVQTFSHSLHSEYASKGISVQCHVPLFIVSKLSKFKRSSAFIPSAETYAKEALRTIGSSPVVSPHPLHEFASYLMDCVPESLVQRATLGYHLGIREKGLKKRAREAEGKKDK